MKKESGHLSINGLKLYYEIYGSGKPLVLLHGGGSTIESNFAKVIPEFAKTHTVIAVELQSHGRTTDRGRPSSFEDDADDVAGLLDHLKIAKADILGFSNGGTTAMQVAMRHPEKVNKLVLASAAFKRDAFPAGFYEFMKNGTIEQMPAALQEAFLKVNPDKKALQTMFDRDSKRMQDFTGWGDEETKKITSPALVVVGEGEVISPEHTLEIARLIPNSKAFILPGGHGGYLEEVSCGYSNPKVTAVFLELVEDFLKD